MKKSIIFGGGCFWCIEAVFQRVKGVNLVTPGYTDGHVENPTYRDVCTGNTGHNEVIKIEYNSDEISLTDLLDIFWTVHNPTTLNQQGADKGTQYRSGVYYNDEDEKQIIVDSIKNVASKLWSDPVITEVKPASEFYPAEKYHIDYYNRNSYVGYCQVVINPKLNKLREKFASRIKEEYNEKA